MNPKIKKIILREVLIILGLGTPAFFCFLQAVRLPPYRYSAVYAFILCLLIFFYLGIWILRLYRDGSKHPTHPSSPRYGYRIVKVPKSVIIFAALIITISIALILFPNFVVKFLSFGR